MKLSEWAKKQGISYLTAYRWFKDGKLPIKAYQSDSGTIIVQDELENLENPMLSNIIDNHSNNIISLFLKKTVEFSKNNASVEDFAAYILSNFSLKLNSTVDHPKYSRNKPKPEEIQKHFQQFLKPKGEKPKPNMLIADGELFDKLAEQSDSLSDEELAEQFIKLPDTPINSINIEDIMNQTEVIPQLNNVSSIIVPNILTPAITIAGGFKPTQKELESATKAMEQIADQLHNKFITPKIKKTRARKK